MLIPLGFLAGSGGVEGDFELISTTLITSNTPSVTFDVSTLASTYKHLQIRATARSNQSASAEFLNVRFNGATSYWQHGLEGNGSSVTSYGSSATSMAMALMANSAATASAFGGGVVEILDPFSTTKNKTVRGFGGLGSTNIALRSGSWSSTSAVTSITCLPFSADNWVSGSRFSLYGIKG